MLLGLLYEVTFCLRLPLCARLLFGVGLWFADFSILVLGCECCGVVAYCLWVCVIW